MAEAPQDSRKSAEEALQASKDILKTEGDINGQLKERVKNLQKVIKAHDDIIGKIKASEELGKDLKELDLDIYKNLRQRVQMENALGRIQMEGQQRGIDLLAIVQEKRESIKASQLQEKLVQAQLNEKKQELLEIENKDLELKELINTKKQELNKSLFEESRLEANLNLLRQEASNLEGGRLKRKKEEIQRVEKNLNTLKTSIKLQNESFNEEEKTYLNLEKQVKEREKSLSVIQGSIVSQNESFTAEEAIVRTLLEELQLNEQNNEKLKTREAQEALIAKRMGITGNLIKGSYGLLNKLGIGAFMNLGAVTQKMQLAAQDGASRTRIMLIGLGATLTAIGDALTDPATIITGIVKGLKFIYDSAVGYQAKMFQAGKDLGLNVTESTRLFKNFQGIAASNGQLAMTARQLVATYAEVNNTLGVMGPQNAEFLTTTTGIQRRIGATAEDMQSVQFYAKATGTSLAQGYSSIIGSAKAQGARLKIAMTEKQIMESISKVSATIFNNFKGNVKQIAEAVVKATKLGLSLDQVQQAGYQLLDFESSISKEFEAQLLTGKNINLARARQLALTGSTEQLMEEITAQLGSQAEWNKMNVIQQQSLAEAMGMSKEAVDEMYKKQQLIAILGADAGASSKTQYEQLLKQKYTHDQIAQIMGDQAASDALAASVQDKMAATMERVKDAIGEATSRFLPLIEEIANFLSDTEKLKQTFEAIATIIGGIAGVSIGMSLQRKAALATEIEARLVTNKLLATQMAMEQSDARRLVSNRGIVLVKKAQNVESSIGLTKTQVQQVAETGLARTTALRAAASAASFAGPAALLVGGAVLSYFMSKLAMSGVSGGGGMSGGGGELPMPEAGIEPVNKEAEVIKDNQSRKINEGRMPDPKYYILQVDPITGNKMERQVTKEYYESQGGQFKNN